MERVFRYSDIVAPLFLLLALGCVFWADSRFALRAVVPAGNDSQAGSQPTGLLLAQRAKPATKRSPPPAPTAAAGVQAPKPAAAKEAVLEDPPPTEPVRIVAAEAKAEPKPLHSPSRTVRQIQIATPYQEPKAIETAKRDEHGNPEGTQFDLARDGAFEGLQIAVLHFYTGEGFNFRHPETALAEKGFRIRRWADSPPSAAELEKVLADSCQLWIISDQNQHLIADHLRVIRDFFDAGRGVYIWGDNAPFYSDANYVAGELFGGRLSGNLQGDRVVRGKTDTSPSGMVLEHLICTGLENLYEGVTISTIETHADLKPIVYGSAGNVVVAAYERDGKRAVLDGGFTRLFNKWDTAGTGRYVKNAAAWLVNYEGAGKAWFDPRYVEGRELLKDLEKAPEAEIVKALSSANPLERWAALVVAQKRNLQHADQFVGLLTDDDEGVRGEARKTLQTLAARDSNGPPADAVDEPWEAVVMCWQQWLERNRLLPSYLPLEPRQILAHFRSPDPLERWTAITAARRQRLAVHEPLIELLRDPDEQVRQEARGSLRQLGKKVDFGPEVNSTEAQITAAVADWNGWLAEENARREHAKVEELRLAQMLLETNPAAARRRLEEITKKHVGSATADEAARLLATLSVPAAPQELKPPRPPSGDVKKTPAATPAAKSDPERERLAAHAVGLAQRILGAHPDKLGERLAEIMAEYPETRAAAQAQTILEGLSP
jgi:hypothetical protein